MNAFRISLAHQDYERSLVDYSFLWQSMPISSDQAALLKSLGVTVNRKGRDLGLGLESNTYGFDFVVWRFCDLLFTFSGFLRACCASCTATVALSSDAVIISSPGRVPFKKANTW